MRAEAYDSNEAYDADPYEAYDAYSERWRPPPGVRRTPPNYGQGNIAGGKPTGVVTQAELQLRLASIARDIATQGEAVTSLGKRVEMALTKIDKDATAARRDMAAARRNVQGAQFMALLPMMLANNTPPQLQETQSGLKVQMVDATGQPIDLSSVTAANFEAKLSGARPIIVDDSGRPARVVTDVEYGALAQQGLAGNNTMMLLLVMMMMGGGFGGSNEGGKEFTSGSDNNMMFMLLIMMMMRPQGSIAPQTQPVAVRS